MRALAIALFFALMGAPAGAQPARESAPYDYLGIALGASLASVAAMPTPEYGWRLVCEADDYFGPEVQKCAYRDPAGRIARLHFDRTAHRSDDHVFYFVDDRADGNLRLFQIAVDGAADGQTREAIIAGFRHDIVAGLSERFGPPQEDGAVANSAGFEPGNLDSRTRWQNTHGAIEVTGPNQSEWGLDRTIRVMYSDPALANRANELRQQWRRSQQTTP